MKEAILIYKLWHRWRYNRIVSLWCIYEEYRFVLIHKR